MTTEATAPVYVDPNTDDLGEFEKLFTGHAKEKTDETPSEIVDPTDEGDELEEAEDVDASEAEDEAPDGDDDSAAEPEEDPKPKKTNRAQDRIKKLIEERETERREKLALMSRIEALENKRTEEVPTPSAPVQSDGPNPDDLNADGSEKYPLGEFDPQYIRDMARHTIAAEWAKKEQEAAEQSQRQQLEKARSDLHDQWVEKLAPAIEQHEDFLDKTMELESAFAELDPAYSDYLVQTIKSLDHGPQVLYYFANNLPEAQKFVKMGALNATLALGEINAMFKGQTRKADPKVSKAPPPPQVNKGTKTRTSVSPDTDDLDDFEKLFYKRK